MKRIKPKDRKTFKIARPKGAYTERWKEMIKTREIPTLKKYVVEDYDDETGELLDRKIQVHIPTLNEETTGTIKWIVRHFEQEYVFVYAKDSRTAAMIASEIMLWPIVKVVLNLKSKKGEFYDDVGNRLEYDFRSKEFYLAEWGTQMRFKIISVKGNSVRVKTGIVTIDVTVVNNGGNLRIELPPYIYISNRDEFDKLSGAVKSAFELNNVQGVNNIDESERQIIRIWKNNR